MRTFLVLVCCLLLKTQVFSQTKRALMIAIGHYPVAGGWAGLSSLRDTQLVKEALHNQEFDDRNIRVVADTQATVEGISRAFETLIRESGPGDIVFIQFSSHGEQVEDDNGDESDCLDESIVSYNAISPAKARVEDYAVNQAAYFRDDKIGAYIEQLRTKLGSTGDVAVFLDLCHSGSGTKGKRPVRGDQPPLVSAGYKGCPFGGADTSGLIMDGASTRHDESKMASYAVISASRAEEVSIETEDDNGRLIGALTFAMSKAFAGLDKYATYRALFARIEAVMNEQSPGQHPVLEGNGIDRQLWGGKFVQQKQYFAISKFINSKSLVLKAGLLAGLDSGAQIALYPSGTVDTAKIKPLARGMVTSAKYFSSVVSLDKNPGLGNPALGWVFVTAPVYNKRPVTIQPIGYSPGETSQLQSAFRDWPLINFKGQPELLLIKGKVSDTVRFASNGYVYNLFPSLPTGIDSLRETMTNYLQYTFLRGLDVRDTTADIEVRLVKFHNKRPDTINVKVNIVNGVYEFREGDSVGIWVKNRSHAPVCINIVDMLPNGVINPIFPNSQIEPPIYPWNLFVPADTSLVFYRYPIEICPPYGTEIFKVFAARQQLNLEFITGSKGQGTRGNFTVLEKLFTHSYKLGLRGDPSAVGKADGSIFSVLFRIKPAAHAN